MSTSSSTETNCGSFTPRVKAQSDPPPLTVTGDHDVAWKLNTGVTPCGFTHAVWKQLWMTETSSALTGLLVIGVYKSVKTLTLLTLYTVFTLKPCISLYINFTSI